jgi:hypothetical protein
MEPSTTASLDVRSQISAATTEVSFVFGRASHEAERLAYTRFGKQSQGG